MGNKEAFKAQMDDLAEAVNEKAGTSGGKTVEELAETVRNLPAAAELYEHVFYMAEANDYTVNFRVFNDSSAPLGYSSLNSFLDRRNFALPSQALPVCGSAFVGGQEYNAIGIYRGMQRPMISYVNGQSVGTVQTTSACTCYETINKLI